MISGEQAEVYKVAQEFSLGDDFTYGINVTLKGKSGMDHRFNLVLTSREDERNRIAVLQDISEDLISDLMEFNAIARDCGIQLKAVSVERDLTKSELNLARVCNIAIIRKDFEKDVHDIFGIKKLDENIGGLMKKGNIYMLSGAPGSGKTALCTQFLVEGAKKGERGMIILTDMQGRDFISHVESFSYGFRDYYKRGGIEVLEISNRILKLKGSVSSDYSSVKNYIGTLTSQLKTLVAEYNISRLVIDPITPLIVADNDFLNQFFKALSVPQTYTLVTSGIGKSDESVYGMEQFFVSGLIKLGSDEPTSDIRKASVVKMSGGVYNETPFFYKITNRGIVWYEEDDYGKAGSLFNQVVL